MAGDQYDRPDCGWAMVVTGVRASREKLAPRCKHLRCYRLTGPIAGARTLPVRVASDRDLENAGAPGSESRMAEEPCGCVLRCQRAGRDDAGRLFGLCTQGRGKFTMFCPTSHADTLVVDSALTARQQVRVGFLMGWRNLSKQHMGYCTCGERQVALVGGGGWACSGPRVACAEQSSFLYSCLKVGTDMCRSHKVSCRNMTELGRMWKAIHVLSACIYLEARDARMRTDYQSSSSTSTSTSSGQHGTGGPAF